MTLSADARTTNLLVLQADLIARKPLRYTPAGLPVFEGRVAHQSTQIEARQERHCQIELACTAVGVVAEVLDRWALGTTARLSGFLASTSVRRQPTLHIQSFEPIH